MSHEPPADPPPLSTGGIPIEALRAPSAVQMSVILQQHDMGLHERHNNPPGMVFRDEDCPACKIHLVSRARQLDDILQSLRRLEQLHGRQ